MVAKGKERAAQPGPPPEPAPEIETQQIESPPSVANSATLEQGGSGTDPAETETMEHKLARFRA
jgi:hypothetical protein